MQESVHIYSFSVILFSFHKKILQNKITGNPLGLGQYLSK